MQKSSPVLMILTIAVSVGSVTAADIAGSRPSDGADRTGQIVVITDPTPTGSFFCGIGVFLYRDAVFLNPGNGTARMVLAIDEVYSAAPGDRFEIINESTCGSTRRQFTLRPIVPGNATPFLFTSTATTTGDDIGIVTGQQDEDGFAKVVLTSKGGKPVFPDRGHHRTRLRPGDRHCAVWGVPGVLIRARTQCPTYKIGR